MSVSNTADIVIIGGGIIGNSIAAYLSNKTESKIVLLEQNQLCSGSTSLSASLVTKLRNQTNLIPFIEETYKAIDRMEKKFGESLGKRKVGCLHLASSQNSEDKIHELVQIANQFNIHVETADKQDIKTQIPWLDTEKIQKAIFVPDEFYLDGSILAMAYFKEARLNGIEYHTNTTVTEIITNDYKVLGVKTNNITWYSSTVIDAAGIWSNLLLKNLRTPVPFAPVRSLYFITETNPEKYPGNQPICILPDANAYTRPESGALLIGFRDQNSPWFHPFGINQNLISQNFISEEEKWEILINETSGLQNLIPDFEDIGIAHTIAAPCAYTHDGNLVLGEIPKIEGLYIATGCNGGGIATSGGIGRVITELVLNEKSFAKIKPFQPDRIVDFNPFSEEFMQTCSATRSRKKSG